MESQRKPLMKTARNYFLELVEKQYNSDKKMTLEQAFDLAYADWNHAFPFTPPYKGFESFRKFREEKGRFRSPHPQKEKSS